MTDRRAWSEKVFILIKNRFLLQKIFFIRYNNFINLMSNIIVKFFYNRKTRLFKNSFKNMESENGRQLHKKWKKIII